MTAASSPARLAQARLGAQQHALQTAVIGGGALPDGLLDAASAGRIEVYRHAYTARLLGALRDNYEVLAKALGDEGFDALGHAYIAAHASPFRSIRWFGDRLAEFMNGAYADHLPHPAFADLARMDWAMRHAYDAATAPVLNAAALRSLSSEVWAEMRLRLQPSACLLDLSWEIGPAWQVLSGLEPGAPEPELSPPEANIHAILVWRQGLQTRWRSLTAIEAKLVRRLEAQDAFAGLCACAAADVGADSAAEAVIACLQQWLADELLASWSPPPRA